MERLDDLFHLELDNRVGSIAIGMVLDEERASLFVTVGCYEPACAISARAQGMQLVGQDLRGDSGTSQIRRQTKPGQSICSHNGSLQLRFVSDKWRFAP